MGRESLPLAAVVLIVDYGAGNLRSVSKAVERVGAHPLVSHDPAALADADAVILPGVGAAADTMAHLKRYRLVEPIRRYIASGRPFLGVCMGLQALLTGSEEGGWHACLDVVPGRVVRLPGGLKVPDMGWNRVDRRGDHPGLQDTPDGAYFYFVHSHRCPPQNDSCGLATTHYGGPLPPRPGQK